MKTTEKFKYLTNNEKKALKELKKEVLKLYPEAKLILFGSKVRGDFDEESDVDVLVVMPELNFDKKEIIWDISNEINWKFDTNISLKVLKKEDLKKYNLSFYKEVKKEGILF